jgi:hypothetical protein
LAPPLRLLYGARRCAKKVSSEIFLVCDGQEQTRKDICASALDTLYYKDSKVLFITRVTGCPPHHKSSRLPSTLSKDICASALDTSDTLYYKHSKVLFITRVAGCPPHSLSLLSTGRCPLLSQRVAGSYYFYYYCYCIIIIGAVVIVFFLLHYCIVLLLSLLLVLFWNYCCCIIVIDTVIVLLFLLLYSCYCIVVLLFWCYIVTSTAGALAIFHKSSRQPSRISLSSHHTCCSVSLMLVLLCSLYSMCSLYRMCSLYTHTIPACTVSLMRVVRLYGMSIERTHYTQRTHSMQRTLVQSL